MKLIIINPTKILASASHNFVHNMPIYSVYFLRIQRIYVSASKYNRPVFLASNGDCKGHKAGERRNNAGNLQAVETRTTKNKSRGILPCEHQ